MRHQDDIVLVTGPNGRIGSAVMRRLRRRLDSPVGLDLNFNHSTNREISSCNG